jgi:hypothetical protein
VRDNFKIAATKVAFILTQRLLTFSFFTLLNHFNSNVLKTVKK